MFISHKKGFLQDYITQLWVKITGKSLKTDKFSWLFGPTGNAKLLGDSYVKNIADENKLSC